MERNWKDKVNVDLERPKDPNAEPYYLLSMFPYPSGRLHMGHVRVYTLSDALARFRFLEGKKVIHPMGWDAFGLPAENAAIESNKNPAEWTWSNINTMKEQLKKMGLNFSWKREVVTCDPSYYRWTQHLFLQMYHRGLAYRKKSIVNWDPVDQTVLADEQVDENGCSWRSGAKVVKKPLTQWFLRTTAFSKVSCELYEGLDNPNLRGWRDIVKIQKNWLGQPTGYMVQLPVEGSQELLAAWTSKLHALHGSSHVLLSVKHHLATGSQPGDQLPLTVLHPLTGRPLPVYAAAHPHPLYAPLARIGVPSVNKEDAEFAQQKDLSFQQVLDGSGKLINSEEGISQRAVVAEWFNMSTGVDYELNGLTPQEAVVRLANLLQEKRLGGFQASPRLDDWLISRQRYWGTPIPIIHCPSCQEVPVPDSDLPVVLPEVDYTINKGVSPLASNTDWINVPCPKCGQPAKRETDTMDTFVDSSWYFLRYLDPHNTSLPFDPQTALPVDVYIGGKEHAVLHLYFSRFFWRFLRSEGCLTPPEPFRRFVSMGMVLGQTYRDLDSGRYVPPAQVESGDPPVEKGTGRSLEVEWDKMSKSKHNGVEPEYLCTLLLSLYNSKINGHYLLGLVNRGLAERLISEGLEIEGTLLRAFPFRRRAVRITLGNLPLFVEDSAISSALAPYGRVTSIAPKLMKAGPYIYNDGRREAFIALHEGVTTERLPTRLEIKIKGEVWPAYLSYGIRCSRCHGQGHRRANCPLLAGRSNAPGPATPNLYYRRPPQ
ncbi:lars-2 [Cordylochernes scorpioides]|uniref:leucine--tRNA ligase n=1 Tax=Cordylochernes scorpioides TaxID=51811 RepID=A0ABY6KIW5_9ARAC|nr:lars-2 [Cordylochernes scorpioides]